MKLGKKLLPGWLLVVIDLLVIAAYVGGFYGLYYRTPRQLTSSGVKTVQESSNTTTSYNEGATSGSTDNSETSSISNTDNESGTSTDSDSSGTSDSTASSDGTGASDTGASDTAASDTTASDKTTTDKDSSNSSTTSTEIWADKFADHFTDTVVTTDNSYSSSDLSITINKYSEGSGRDIVTYYVADIYLADITCLQSGFADNTYGVGYTEHVLDMDEEFNAVLAINGDYYGNGGNGVVIRNGEVYRDNVSGSDVCVLYYDGTMKTYTADEFDVDQAIADGAYQAWSFGPELLDASGNSKTDFTADGHVQQTNPRSAIGYYEPGHYCLVVVDGRQNGYSIGMSLTEFSQLFEKLGCTTAYNLDGGKSSEMTFNDTYVNQPADGGRAVSDCIILKEAN